VLAPSVAMHVAMPEPPPPLQPPKLEPTSACAVRVTRVPGAKLAAHVTGQPMPVGALVIVPPPLPVRDTVSETVGTVKVAVTRMAPSLEASSQF